jgi:phosphinothricin acetyltransferase
MEIRPCREGDLEQLNDLYNYYIRETPITFDIEPIPIDARRAWFSHYADTGRHRVLVALDDTAVLGYASSSSFRPKRAYETSVETSVYLAHGNEGQGIGTELYRALFETISGEDIHRAYAGITMPNEASVALHARFGFRQAGYFTEQGRKFDRYWDVAWFEKELT